MTDDASGLIRNGRYAIVPEAGGKAVLRTRVTNFASTLDDTFYLQAWGSRQVLLGVAGNPHLQIAALANPDDAKELDRLVDAAKEAAGAHAARQIGSALHALTERVDKGEELELPPSWGKDVEAYRRATAELQVDEIEQVCVIPHLGLAGRFDRIVWRGDERFILDVKTGKDLSYSWGSIAVQLACYATAATIYNPDTETHRPMPKVNQDVGLVAHLPAGTGTCTIHEVDLSVGHAGIEVIQHVKAWRKRKAVA